jgi:hypothetical protein
MHSRSPRQRGRRNLGIADAADLPFLHELRQRARHVFDGNGLVAAVDVVEVHMIHTEPPQ